MLDQSCWHRIKSSPRAGAVGKPDGAPGKVQVSVLAPSTHDDAAASNSGKPVRGAGMHLAILHEEDGVQVDTISADSYTQHIDRASPPSP